MITGELVSRSSTTSWSDWHHGDLLLTSDALVRVRLPEPTPEARRLRDSVGPEPQYRALPGPADAHPLLAADSTNRYILLAGVAAARLHRGILSDRLALTMQDGVRLKLLWLRVDPGYKIFRRDLPNLLGPAFSID